MDNPVNILILADRDAKSLWPLTEMCPPPLLPVGGKPVIAHLFETLSTCVRANVTLVVADGDARTPAWLAKRGYPRLTIKITTQATPIVEQDTLVFRGDILVNPINIKRFIEECGAPEAETRQEPRWGAWKLRAGDLTPTWRHTAMLADHADTMLSTIAAYWRVNIAANAAECEGLKLAGWVGGDGLRTGIDARVLTRRAVGRNISIGDGAFIDKLVSLGDNVVIGDDCFIAKAAMLANTVILPGSYVGPGLELERAVVAGEWLCRIDTGTATRVEDATVIGRLAA